MSPVTDTSIPSPPLISRVSVRRLIPIVAEVSSEIVNVVATSTSPAAVKRPCASTVNVGIFVCEPYAQAVTAVLFKLNVVVPAVSLYVDVNAVPANTDEPITS